jgi:16S rRNA (cytidine1402-2'-O)-methyltransferase
VTGVQTCALPIWGSVSDIIGNLKERNQIKGECTVILSGANDEKPDMEMILEEIKIRLSSESISPSHLSKDLAEKYGLSRRIIYEEILRIRERSNE